MGADHIGGLPMHVRFVNNGVSLVSATGHVAVWTDDQVQLLLADAWLCDGTSWNGAVEADDVMVSRNCEFYGQVSVAVTMRPGDVVRDYCSGPVPGLASAGASPFCSLPLPPSASDCGLLDR